ncbi:hypothetical protein SBA6_630032 [Candidatus Sulfopaludibacter sp. SbA6]|nr:hypothetical protein SBA6_630032 [Candidatus Sulfopaludibacter sp. SbA6]
MTADHFSGESFSLQNSSLPNQEPKGDVILVDDQPDNLDLLDSMLRRRGYRVCSFPCGRLAPAAAVQSPPDWSCWISTCRRWTVMRCARG